jgi:hypothetical protein
MEVQHRDASAERANPGDSDISRPEPGSRSMKTVRRPIVNERIIADALTDTEVVINERR